MQWKTDSNSHKVWYRYDVPNCKTLQNAKACLLREKLEQKRQVDRAEKIGLREASKTEIAYFKEPVCLMGYRFGFEDILKTYSDESSTAVGQNTTPRQNKP